MKPTRGLRAFAHLLIALRDEPMTIHELIERGIVKRQFAYQATTQLHAAGLLHIAAIRKVAYRHHPKPVYAFGTGVDAPARRLPQPQLTAHGIQFVSVWRALESASTVADLHEETGIDGNLLRRLLKVLHGARLVRIGGWSRRIVSGGIPVAAYEVGSGKDEPRPKPLCRLVRNRQYRARRAEFGSNWRWLEAA